MDDKKFLQEIIRLAFNITNCDMEYETIITNFIDLITVKHDSNHVLYHIFSKKNDVIKDIISSLIIRNIKLFNASELKYDDQFNLDKQHLSKIHHELSNNIDLLDICNFHLADKMMNNALDLQKISIKVDKTIEDKLSSNIISIPSSDKLSEI